MRIFGEQKETARDYSALSHRIRTQFVLTLAVYLLALFAGYFLTWFLCEQFTWQWSNPLYHILKFLQMISPVILVLAILLGVFFLMMHFLSKPIRYLDEVIGAAESMAESPEKSILLPEELRDTQNELNLVRERALRNETLAREAEQRKNDLIVYLAHDLKTPLTSVIGYLMLLRDEPDLPPQQRARYTGIALDKAERLEGLLNEFFEITRFNLSVMELRKQTINLSRMLEQVLSESEPMLAERRMIWNARITPGIGIIGDPEKLERVFDNLIRNAVFYGYEDTEIMVLLERDGADIRLCFENHGPTIPPEQLGRIFERFFRLDASRASASGGAGLGLAIAKEIVEAHGGGITARSEDERIAFFVRLPSVAAG